AGIRPEAADLLRQVEAERPAPGTVRLTYFAEVAGVYHVHQLAPALLLSHRHLWSEETVRARFAYKRPGLYVLPVRVYRAAEAFELPETPYYAGCRSWVELERELPTAGATPVLAEETFQDLLRSLNALLRPSAFA